MVIWFPATRTLDTLLATDERAPGFLTDRELQKETRAYVVGDKPPHYPVPALVYDFDLANGDSWV